jgi:hypothetical protein
MFVLSLELTVRDHAIPYSLMDAGNRNLTSTSQLEREKKKGLHFSMQTLVFLVRLAGIEPTTPWFVAKYSIQLSYSRLEINYSTKFGRA